MIIEWHCKRMARVLVLALQYYESIAIGIAVLFNKKAMLSQGNRAMLQLFFSV